MIKLYRLFVPMTIGFLTYHSIKLFDNKNTSNIDSQKDLKGEDVGKNNLIRRLAKRINNNRPLKIALISMLATVGVQNFYPYLKTILLNRIISGQSIQELNEPLKIFVKAVEEHDLYLHSKSIKTLLKAEGPLEKDKIELLKIRLDLLINTELDGHTNFIIISMLAAILGLCISSVGGLGIVLQALHKLFLEGRISQEVYESLVDIAKNSTST